MHSNILRLKDVSNRCGFSRSTVYRLIQQAGFPKPIKLTVRSSGWLESDINQWIDNRIKARNSKASKGVKV